MQAGQAGEVAEAAVATALGRPTAVQAYLFHEALGKSFDVPANMILTGSIGFPADTSLPGLQAAGSTNGGTSYGPR